MPIFVSEKAASVLGDISHGGEKEGASMGICINTHVVLDSASLFSNKAPLRLVLSHAWNFWDQLHNTAIRVCNEAVEEMPPSKQVSRRESCSSRTLPADTEFPRVRRLRSKQPSCLPVSSRYKALPKASSLCGIHQNSLYKPVPQAKCPKTPHPSRFPQSVRRKVPPRASSRYGLHQDSQYRPILQAKRPSSFHSAC